MIRDTVAFLRGEGRRVFLDAEHFFDGYRDDRAYALEVAAGGGRGRRRGRRPVRHQRRHAAAAGRRRRRTTSRAATGARLGIHCHNDTGCAVANSLAAVEAGADARAGHRSTATASAPATPTCSPSSRTWSSSSGTQVAARRPAARGDPDRARDRRGDQRAAVLPPAVRRRAARSRTRPACTPARSRSTRPLPAHRPDGGRQRHADARLGHGRPGQHRAQGPRARASTSAGDRDGSRRRHRAGQGRWRLRGYTFDAADASFELLLREEVDGAAPDYFDVESLAGHHRRPAPRRRGAVSEATVKLRRRRRAGRRDGRGQRPGQRARPRPAAGARAGLPASSTSSS